jgi:ectoine hydroxylase-related dioxygenase (phytanoyl-CoA dioxygenase family)
LSQEWTAEQVEAFERDGFLIIEEGFIGDEAVELMRERFDSLFAGDYTTGIRPDEVNWVAGRDPEDRTRQICNGWKADPLIARQVLAERTGRLAAELMGWEGLRILQDNCIWKPPRTKSLGMHQDGSYLDYLVPPEMITCWIALDDTSAEAGTITYAAGSHRWPRSAKNRGEFHAPPDWLEPVERALPAGEELGLVPIEVKAGGASFHHFNTFHGSGPNTAAVHRRAVISHLIPAATEFHPVNADPVYSRYRKVGDTTMDESYFPIVWSRDGGRSDWLDTELAQDLAGMLAEPWDRP